MADQGKITYSTQEAVNPGCHPQAFGAASLYGVRGIHCNTANAYNCTFYNGTKVKLALLSGIIYPYAVRMVAASNDAALSSSDALVIAIR